MSFYDRDLFDITSPLRKDLYFFGRTDLINKLVDRHSSNENSGVFGLRRSGKTSLIYAVERLMERGCFSLYLHCL
jgi:predicted AAA+ superfamily ATPase